MDYDWLDKAFPIFLRNIGADQYIPYAQAIIVADADKCVGYRHSWEKSGIPYEHGVLLYLITKIAPYSMEVRETSKGWVAPKEWVLNNYHRFAKYIEG